MPGMFCHVHTCSFLLSKQQHSERVRCVATGHVSPATALPLPGSARGHMLVPVATLKMGFEDAAP